MALGQKISSCLQTACTELVLTDITGMYDILLNPTGWGAPNLTPATITSAEISIVTSSSSTVYTFDVTTELQAITLPSAFVQNYTFAITTLSYTDVGESSNFPDGIYTITYTIDGTDVVSKSIFMCNTQCCVDKMLLKAMDSYLCGQKCVTDSLIMEVLKARAMLLQASKWSFSCGSFTKAQTLISQAKKICSKSQSNCGCS